jgi:hypothetical protein
MYQSNAQRGGGGRPSTRFGPHIITEAGHAFNEPEILHELIEATDRFANRK